MANARFLLRPRWVLSHLLVALVVVTMVSLGFWQLRRLDDKRDRNTLIESRRDQPVEPVDDLLEPAADDGAVEAARFRTVTATGSYDEDATVTVRNRTQNGAPGAWLVTPLRLEGGARVGVIRGFVSFTPDGAVVDAPAPDGTVTVTGLVVDPDQLDGTAPEDVAPLLAGDDVLPALVRADESDPPEPNAGDAGAPDPEAILTVPPPELSEGPHLGYAVQWFIFSAIAVIGYPFVLRRVIVRRGKEVDDGGDDLDRELDDLLRQG